MAENTYTIKGTVLSRSTGSGISDLKVEAWDNYLIHDNLVGSAVTDAEGAFQIEFTELLDRRPALYFKVFLGDRQLSNTGDTVSWNVDTGEILVTIEVDLESPPNLPFVVKGRVVHVDGRPFAGGVVRAFDVRLRSDALLGQTTTDPRGGYEIRYSAEQFQQDEQDTANLRVSAWSAAGGELARSPILFNAPPSAEVDLTIPVEGWQPPTLFEKIAQALTPLLEGLKVEELEEDQQHQDLSFLSGETGFEKNVLARFVMAHKLTAAWYSTGILVRPAGWFVFPIHRKSKPQRAARSDFGRSILARCRRRAQGTHPRF